MGRNQRLALRLVLVLLTTLVSGCTRPPASHPRTPLSSPLTPTASPSMELKLSDGADTSEADKVPTAQTTWLNADQARAILARMPALKSQDGDKQRFAMRPKSLAPPQTGTTVKTAFPPAASPTPPEVHVTQAPLTVVRFAPDGDVPLAPELSVTFSQPMVPLSALSVVEAQDVPVKLTPQPKGVWHWLGTKTVVFKPGERFAMATEYTVDVPAGTTSALHQKLDKPVHFAFRTPPPVLTTSSPTGGPQPLEPLILLGFDQPVDPQSVLKAVRVKAGTQTPVLRLATPEELATANVTLDRDRQVAVHTTGPLPPATSVQIVVGSGLRGLEGPRPTDHDQSFSFETYGPFAVQQSSVGTLQPLSQLWIRFSNPIDLQHFRKSMVRVTPDIPHLSLSANGSMVFLSGWTCGRTTYTVHLDGNLADIFGQRLGAEKTVSFQVGPATAALRGTGSTFIVADPNQPPTYSVLSTNYDHLRVHLYQVQPQDWQAFQQYEWGWNREGNPAPPPGREIQSDLVSVSARSDEQVETRIDLNPALQGRPGNVVVVVEPPTQPVERYQRTHALAWVEVTKIGLDACAGADHVVLWSNSLLDGKPLSGVTITVAGNPVATTGADGLCTIPLPEHGPMDRLEAHLGQDVAFLPDQVWGRRLERDLLRWYVFDDRQMYRPGEDVHVKGWIRRVGAGTQGDLSGAGPGLTTVSYTLSDSQGNKIAQGQRPVDALGGFDLGLTLPKTVNLGSTNLVFEALGTAADGLQWTHTIQVQEFRRPEFEVSAQTGSGPFFLGDAATASVNAHYYAGGGLPNAQVTWRVSASPGSFTPPGRSDYSFGAWTPWWGVESFGAPRFRGRYREWEEEGPGVPAPTVSQVFSSHTDGTGHHTLKLDLHASALSTPIVLQAEASVMDVNRQAWNASTSLLVHPSHVYVGLKSTRTFVESGEPLKLDVIVADVDGKLVTGRPVHLHLVRQAYETDEAGQYHEVDKDAQDQDVASVDGPAHVEFQVPTGGTWHLTAGTSDTQGHPNSSSLTLWASGGEVNPGPTELQQQAVSLIPDQHSWQPGETAEILVQSPFHPAEGLLSLRRSGLVSTQRFRMEGSSYTIKIPIVEGYTPNLTAQVDLVGATARQDAHGDVQSGAPLRPAYASGSLSLSVPPLSRTLAVSVKPARPALEPGAQTSMDVDVQDAAGHPVAGGQVAAVVVDESVLALTGYRLPDALATFYSTREPDVQDVHSRASVFLSNTTLATEESDGGPRGFVAAGALPPGAASGGRAQMEDLRQEAPRAEPEALKKAAVMTDTAAAPAPPPPIQMRTNFNALANFTPASATDAQGRAHIAFKLPDNLTRYRIMVVAVAGDQQFGQAESTVTARMPLMVRPSAPRFLNFGDRFELPIVVQNQTDDPMTVDVAVRTNNLQLPKGGGQRVVVPANNRVEVRFPAATVEAGTARFQVAVTSGKWADGSEMSLPVWTPATTEAFATYGVIDDGALTQPVTAPPGVYPQFGGLEISTSSTAVASLTDAVLYLEAYPYECSEQISSRVLAVAALRDVLSAFKAQGLPSTSAMLAAMDRDITRLHSMQHDDGGFSYWRRDDEEYPYLSVHVAHTLQRAQEKGFNVPPAMLALSKQYLEGIDTHIPADYPDLERCAIQSYALYVRQRMQHQGPTDATIQATARQLVDTAGDDGLSMESVGWLLTVLSKDPASASQVQRLRRHIANRVSETAGDAHFVTAYKDGEHLLMASDMRADGVLLDALLEDQPKSDLIPKLVHGLLDHRVQGRWSSTQENAFVLLALDHYFNTFEHVTPDFVARVWLGGDYAGEHAFKGRTTEKSETDIPMEWLLKRPGQKPLVLAKDGPGRLYYRLGMSYAPQNLKLPAADYGFTVQRTYHALDDPKDVRCDADGTWHVKAGARVQVELSMVAPSRRYHVALVDPLPAGLEAMNPELMVTGTVPQNASESRGSGWWWGGAWYEHQNLRDERAEAFTSLLWEGVYTYSYVARATTPGTFVVPPTKAEEMYHPETFGRSASDRLIVE